MTPIKKGMPDCSGIPGDKPAIPMGEVPEVTRKWIDLVYASLSPAHKLDIYLPEEGEGPFPVLFYTHGGGFRMGDKLDIYLASYLHALDRGYALVSVNYRLSGEAVFPAPLQDCKAALRWLRANGAKYGLDMDRVATGGQSSGGNFSAMMCVSAGVELFEDPALGNPEQSTAVQAGFDWYGPTDFSMMDEQLAAGSHGVCDHSEPDSPESKYLGTPVPEVPDLVALANPMTYVNPDMAPLLIQHGRDDVGVPVQQSEEFAKVIKEKAGPGRCELDIIDGARHDSPVFTSPANLDRVFGFLDRYLK
jgi:acetyl esterase/lipase